MWGRIEFFLFLLVLYCSPSSLQPLAHPSVGTTSNDNNLAVSSKKTTKLNEVEEITEKNLKVTELIQQIDVKDDEKQVTSNISNVVISNEANNETQDNDTTFNAETESIPLKPIKSNIWNATGNVTNEMLKNATTSERYILNDSLSSALDNNEYAWRSDLPDKENKEEVILKNILNTTLNGNHSNDTLNNTSSDSPDNSSHQNVSINSENIEDDNGIPISWRLDKPRKKKIATKTNFQNETNSPSNDLKTGDENENNILNNNPYIFMLMNSGNMNNISINMNVDNVLTKDLQLNTSTINNLNSNNSILINKLVNTTINNVLLKLLLQNVSNLNSKNIYVFLNSGNISNVLINPSSIEESQNSSKLKSNLKVHSNNSNLNNNKENARARKHPSNLSYPIIDVKFRSSENKNTKTTNKYDEVVTADLLDDISNTLQNNHASDQSNIDVDESPIEDKNISRTEAPALRSINKHKKSKTLQAPNVIHTTEKPNENILSKLLPESQSIDFDLSKIPVDNIFGTALDFIKRLKRDTIVKSGDDPWSKICDSSLLDNQFKLIFCEDTKTHENNLKFDRRSLDDTYNLLKLSGIIDESDKKSCPVSLLLRLVLRHTLDELRYSDSAILRSINQISKSLLEGNEASIDLVSQELFSIPFPVKLKLLLVHGDTKEFINELSKHVDSILCQ